MLHDENFTRFDWETEWKREKKLCMDVCEREKNVRVHGHMYVYMCSTLSVPLEL